MILITRNKSGVNKCLNSKPFLYYEVQIKHWSLLVKALLEYESSWIIYNYNFLIKYCCYKQNY